MMCRKEIASSLRSTETSVTDDASSLDSRTVQEVEVMAKTTEIQRQWKETALYGVGGIQASSLVVVFALYFPFILGKSVATETYQFARWNYDETSLFDNTVWTYGTDYIIGFFMTIIAASIPTSGKFQKVGIRTRGLLGSYVLSVIMGAIAHQFYTTIDQRNTTSFRFLWTICVGAVAAASGFMGGTATELVHLMHARGQPARFGNFVLPAIPETFWIGYAIFVSLAVILGGFSCQRPACDIFFVGITQFPSTFYIMAVISRLRMQIGFRISGCLGFILNAPLLPLYPILVQYWSLASVNVLLHSWLLVAWSLQGLCVRQFGLTIPVVKEL